MRLSIAFMLIVMAAPLLLAGGEKNSRGGENTFTTSGDIRTDILSISSRPLGMLAAEGEEEIHRKSPYLAAGLSAVLPGAGEFYSESYWKSALFIAVEATLWTVNIIYNNKGDKQTDIFKKYADEHWSVVSYAEWINANLKYLNPQLDAAQYVIPIDPDPNNKLPPWKRVDWNTLNNTEDAVSKDPNSPGSYFSHHLAQYGDQQYYEMIGKYHQFVHGWDETDFNAPIDQVTPQLTLYAGQRGKANNLYNTASTATTIIVLNHVLSALDAAWSAHSYNTIHAEVIMQRMPTPQMVLYVPTMKISVSF
ncbi:MAG: hypothetical protein ABSB78_01400 [Bacteroidota bacterium]